MQKKFLTIYQILLKAAKGMIKQNKRSANYDGTCRYKSGKMRCGVGFCIKPPQYSENIEFRTVTEALHIAKLRTDEKQPLIEALLNSNVNVLDTEVAKLLQTIQEIHDDKEPREWKVRLLKVAKKVLSEAENAKFREEIDKVVPKSGK